MRPISVEFQAFGPYVGHERVDFEAISSKGLFLICGKTGTGKTTILDAMTFALYGKSSGHGRDDFEAMRCTKAPYDKTTFVRFVFEYHGKTYRFERRLERKVKNLSASYDVSCLTEEGVWKPFMENAKEKAVNAKAVEIIGLEYDQFRQVIVLPQGQFEKLLTSNSDEKEKILTSIFGEDKWQSIAERFFAKAESKRNEIKEIQRKIQISLEEENCSSVAQLDLLASNKHEEANVLKEEFEKQDYEKLIKEQQDNLALANRFGDLRKAEDKISFLESQKENRSKWEVTLNNAKRADNVRLLIESERTSAETLRKRKAEAELTEKNAESKKTAHDEAIEQLKQHEAKRSDIEKLKEKQIQYEGKCDDYEGLDTAEKELKQKKKEVADATEAENKAKAICDAYAESIVCLQNEYKALQAEHDHLLNTYLAGITGELAAQLIEGRPCPVCGSREHPNKATVSANSITKSEVDKKKNSVEQKYLELQDESDKYEKAKNTADEKHATVEKAKSEVVVLTERLESKRKNLVEGIENARQLKEEINKIRLIIDKYELQSKKLTELEKKASEAIVEANAKIESATNEVKEAEKLYTDKVADVEKGLSENHFATREEAERLMLDNSEMQSLSSKMADYDAGLKTARETLNSLREELKEKDEVDADKCREIIDKTREAQDEYNRNMAVLSSEIKRLDDKVSKLKEAGKGMEERVRQADEDFAFAKKLRGDSGTGLQRYVLGIMFSSVVTAANKMLEMVHGGRYRLFRSDDKAQGTNKKGLELKVFDNNSEEHDGRFVSTLSGGEKFLASLALSIGMSTVAQKSGIKIEALFIDEGFGSLDEESIADAMSVLNSIQEANGLVGIISHVQILEDQIPSKLLVEEDSQGSHIVQTIG
ncbi:MAG: SMC family ATPase [Lachnospiraceae bacterium]|nr:SMC family ATPase [Lachnospiraceae bacterium]